MASKKRKVKPEKIERTKKVRSIKGKKAYTLLRRERRRGKYKGKHPHIYDIYFPGAPKTLKQIDDIISLKLPTLPKLPEFKGIERTQVKLTVISQNRQRRSAVTYIYNIYEPFELNLALLDILYEIYLSPKRGQKGYLQKVRAGYVNQIVVDFETSV